ncbi:MAG TPA: M56 family metallopeptidase [Acidimicrobiales bacterium]|nr:M56 family metallopeptidase [Acidimicrobiales bacterium]
MTGRVARLDSANRSFFALVAAALVPYVLLGALGCGVLSLAGYRLVTEGWGGLDRGGEDLRAAVVFFGLVTAGTVVALLSVRRQVRATRALGAGLRDRMVTPASDVADVAARVGLAGRVEVVDDRDRFSFTYGVVRPRVVVSRGLVAALSPEELAAVLHHERYHVGNWDTLKVMVARAAPAAFFFLPALGHLRDRYLAGRELAADRRAIDAAGGRPLAAALHQALERPAWASFGAAAAVGGSEFLAMRVEQLESGREPSLARVPRWASAVTVAGLGLLSSAFVLAVTTAGAGMAMMGEGSDGRGPLFGGTGSTVLGVLGGAVCMAAWVGIAFLVVRRGFHRGAGHIPLILRSQHSTNRSSSTIGD